MDRRYRPQSEEVLNLGSTARTRTPEQTLECITPYLEEAGITRLANITHLDTLGLPVYTAIRPNSRNLTTSQGKGQTDALAKCSALMEALEYFHIESAPEDRQDFVQAIPEDERLFEGLTPSAMQYSLSEIGWTECYHLLEDRPYWVPTELLSYDFSTLSRLQLMFQNDTTGVASGNTYQEAICHAVYEIIERKALAYHHMSPPTTVASRVIKLASIEDPTVQQCLSFLEDDSVEVTVFDITDHSKVPAYLCMIANAHPLRTLPCFSGSGAHLDASIALCRAITEAAQSRLTYISGARDDLLPHDYYMPIERPSFTPMKAYSMPAFTGSLSTNDQLIALMALLDQYDQRLIAYEYTPTGHPYSVVKAMIPGFQ